MGQTDDAILAKYTEPDTVLGVQALVSMDGSEARLTLHTSDGRIHLTVPFEQISAFHTEVRHASAVMLYRQSQTLTAENALDLLLETAVRPLRISTLIDQATNDRIFVMEFCDRMPIVTRMSADAVNSTITEMTAAIMASAH